MTFYVVTESHGTIESGFIASFTAFPRLGEYCMPIQNICEMIRVTADNPEMHETEVIGYDLDTFWNLQTKYLKEITNAFKGDLWEDLADGSLLERLKEVQSVENQGKLSKGEQEIYNKTRILPVTIAKDESRITIAEYVLAAAHFGRMAQYLAQGGILGWNDHAIPDFAVPTMQAIMNSQRGLYAQIRKEIEESHADMN